MSRLPAISAAETLRIAFDGTFAALPSAAIDTEDFLVVGSGETSRAIRLSEIAGLHRATRIVPVPSPAPQLIGLAGLRGRVVPVYDLLSLLGLERTAPVRWLALTAGIPIAIGFETLERHVRLARGDATPVVVLEVAKLREQIQATMRSGASP
jgi:chemotaxis signal transduction protein